MPGAFERELSAERPTTPDGYSPAPTDWDEGGLHRIEPRVMLAWRDMPTATRWRFPRE